MILKILKFPKFKKRSFLFVYLLRGFDDLKHQKRNGMLNDRDQESFKISEAYQILDIIMSKYEKFSIMTQNIFSLINE
jgi:hypothetical protein